MKGPLKFLSLKNQTQLDIGSVDSLLKRMVPYVDSIAVMASASAKENGRKDEVLLQTIRDKKDLENALKQIELVMKVDSRKELGRKA